MTKVYKLLHKRFIEYFQGEPVHDSKLIGYFSSLEQAKQAEEKYKHITGFEQFPNDFVIEELNPRYPILHFPKKKIEKIYELTHCYEDQDGYDNVTYFDVYATLKQAQNALKKWSKDKEFREHLDGFWIATYELNVCEWREGFLLED